MARPKGRRFSFSFFFFESENYQLGQLPDGKQFCMFVLPVTRQIS
jgi:hypothetical protein